jgi:hypothetical protein
MIQIVRRLGLSGSDPIQIRKHRGEFPQVERERRKEKEGGTADVLAATPPEEQLGQLC